MDTVRLKVASASLNQTVYDFATNVPNILAAIDRAVADGADVLSLEELALTGYSADDYHQWFKSNDQLWPYIDLIASYAYEKNPNLVVSMGTPWYYADKSKPASDPEYNLNNRPYNTQMTITQGRVVAVSAKSILADGPAEYEPRQFNDWPLSKGTIDITLPDGSTVPFGKPLVMLDGGAGKRFTLYHEICAEGWPGVHDDLSVDVREQNEARHIVAVAADNDISVALNPSASKPQCGINKEKIRMQGLCMSGSQHCGVYVYTNFLGSGSGSYAAEGSQIFAQDGQIIHHGQRYTYKDVSYSSIVVDVPAVQRAKPDAVEAHALHPHEAGETAGQEALFDAAYKEWGITTDQLAYEEYMRSISLWLRDYLSKLDAGIQGYVVSLSGGKDSAYGALAVAMMIDQEVAENGIDGFFKRFKRLDYEAEVKAVAAEKGQVEAVKLIKKHFLTCVYMPTENSSARTQNAARFLIEGGVIPAGIEIDGEILQEDRHVEGIGGEFIVVPVQAAMEEEIFASCGLDMNHIAASYTDEILGGKYTEIDTEARIVLARDTVRRKIMGFVNETNPAKLEPLPHYITSNATMPVPTWSNPADDLTLQNIQVRVRVPPPWMIANKQRKCSVVTSNKSEGVHGYSTAAGDSHLGAINPIGGIDKDTLTDSLAYFQARGLLGFTPVESLFWINREKPSAELRKAVAGATEQTDESDLGFSYAQSKFIESQLLTERKLPTDVLKEMLANPEFPDDAASNRMILLGFCKRWAAAQFKRIMAVLAPHTGGNVDPHLSVRTTVLGDHFRTTCAHMSIDVLAGNLGVDEFSARFDMTPQQAKIAAGMNAGMRSFLISRPLADIKNADNWAPFANDNRAILHYARASAAAGAKGANAAVVHAPHPCVQ